LSDIRRSDIFRGYLGKNFHGCPINAFVTVFPLLVYSSRPIGYDESKIQPLDISEWEVELVRVIGKVLNISMHIVYIIDGKYPENIADFPFIFVGAIPAIEFKYGNLQEFYS
jgi:hypothetical protein